MIRAPVLAAVVLLAGCGGQPPAPGHGDTAGDRLEAAAIAAGVVADPARENPVGLYGRGGDRVCVVPRTNGPGYSIGVLVRFEDGQGCTTRGVAASGGDSLRVGLTDGGADDCHFIAHFEGDRIVLPAELPQGCDRRCTGHATLAALAVDLLSDGSAEAAAERDGQGRPLCAT